MVIFSEVFRRLSYCDENRLGLCYFGVFFASFSGLSFEAMIILRYCSWSSLPLSPVILETLSVNLSPVAYNLKADSFLELGPEKLSVTEVSFRAIFCRRSLPLNHICSMSLCF